jgi:hypothetical protein
MKSRYSDEQMVRILRETDKRKKLLAERDFQIDVMKNISRKNGCAPARRVAALYAIERGIAKRRACARMEVGKSSPSHIPVLPKRHTGTG